MRITIRQLKRLIREAVEDASGEQLFDPRLGLQDVTTDREAANGTVSLLDPETGDKYKVIRSSRYLRLYQPEWEVMAGKSGSMSIDDQRYTPLMLIKPSDTKSDAEFIKYVYERITQYVWKRRKSLAARKKERQMYNDRNTAFDARANASISGTVSQEDLDFEDNNPGPRSPGWRKHNDEYINRWKDRPTRAGYVRRSVD